MKTSAWDGSTQEFWAVIKRVRYNEAIESDEAVLSEVLLGAQALTRMVVYAEQLEAKLAALSQATGALVQAARQIAPSGCDADALVALIEALRPFGEEAHA